MKGKELNSILREHGVGKAKPLPRGNLKNLQVVCKKFRKAFLENCTSHVLYRCRVVGVDSGIVVSFWGGDENGNMKRVNFAYEFGNASNPFSFDDALELEHTSVIIDAFFDMVRRLTEIMDLMGRDISMMDIPMEGDFLEGYITGYKREEGTLLIVVKDSLEYDYFTD